MQPQSRADRFTWLERAGDDFPYYRGRPVGISGRRWWIVMVAVAAAFFALIFTQPVFRTGIAGFIPAVLFVVMPLAALAFVAGSGWKALFRSLRAADFGWMALFFVLNWVVTIIVGFLAVQFFDAQANPAGQKVAAASDIEQVLFFAKTAVQLFGEELFTILPFLALLYWLAARHGMGRKMAVVLASIAVAAVFAAVHLPTYRWNVPHAFVALVPIRLVLLLPYIMTKNIWVSTGTHILNDWAIFGLPLLIGGQASQGGG